MRKLFEIDKKDHFDCTREYVRNSARSIVIKAGKVAMVHSLLYDYYKFPGGGIEQGESPVEAMIRETREEAGLVVLPQTVKPFGCVRRVEKYGLDPSVRFVQDNFYYLCEVEDRVLPQALDEYEAEESFRLEFVAPIVAIEKNRLAKEGAHSSVMFEREARVLELLIKEGCFT